ncbi:MAG: hypothetical protein B7733_06370 [Myxococcales bacterium FL481]|nr:MAG: hypothetical protein B7733_06370 [Myxococcales bacterium FL481]
MSTTATITPGIGAQYVSSDGEDLWTWSDSNGYRLDTGYVFMNTFRTPGTMDRALRTSRLPNAVRPLVTNWFGVVTQVQDRPTRGFQLNFDNGSPAAPGQTFLVGETITFGSGATGIVRRSQESAAIGHIWFDTLSGGVPLDNDTISGGTSSKTADVNGDAFPWGFISNGEQFKGAMRGLHRAYVGRSIANPAVTVRPGEPLFARTNDYYLTPAGVADFESPARCIAIARIDAPITLGDRPTMIDVLFDGKGMGWGTLS